MIYLGYLVVGVLVAVLLLQWRMAAKARAMEGRALPELPPAIADKLRARRRVMLYFFSPTCGPCRAMTPRIDRLASRHDNVFKLDAGLSRDIAHRLGVMATPTTLLLSEDRIAAVKLGAMSEDALEKLLA